MVVVAVPAGAHEVPEDRMAMLCRQAGADRRQALSEAARGSTELCQCALPMVVAQGAATAWFKAVEAGPA